MTKPPRKPSVKIRVGSGLAGGLKAGFLSVQVKRRIESVRKFLTTNPNSTSKEISKGTRLPLYAVFSILEFQKYFKVTSHWQPKRWSNR